MLRQFKLFYAGQAPVAVELYAKVTPEVAARIDGGNKKLTVEEWNGGKVLRLVDRIELPAIEALGKVAGKATA